MATPNNCPLPPPDLVIEDARFVYKPNFEGRETTFKDEGVRFFNVRVPDNIVDAVIADNWNVKWTKPKSEGYDPEPYIEVAIGFKYRPADIAILRDGVEKQLDETNCGIVDKLQFDRMDIVLRGRDWRNEHSGACGIKAWLKTFRGVVEMDPIQQKYAQRDD